MTVSPQVSPQVGISRRRQNIRAAELRAYDLNGECSHCFEYAAPGDVWCQACGNHLTEQRQMIPRGGAWSTSA